MNWSLHQLLNLGFKYGSFNDSEVCGWKRRKRNRFLSLDQRCLGQVREVFPVQRAHSHLSKMEEDEKVKKNSYVNLERGTRHTVMSVIYNKGEKKQRERRKKALRKLGTDKE